MFKSWDIGLIRSRFPALNRSHDGQPVIFLDGPAGSQVPLRVAEAVSDYLLTMNANCGGLHATSQETDALLQNAHQTLADFLGTTDPQSVIFGPNMTSMTLNLSHILARSWGPGDEIIVSCLDHDANVTPWELAARIAGVTVRRIPLRPDNWTLDKAAFHELLSKKTRLVAVGYASNATGTINPVKGLVAAARDVGALTFIDAVHYAPHRRINVTDLDCDFLVCSAYKFFGPHVGVMYGRRELLESLQPDKLRPASDALPDRWMTGTQNHEGIAGAAAAVEYLASLGAVENGHCDPEDADCASTRSRRSTQLDTAFERIEAYERTLSLQFLERIDSLVGCVVQGIGDPNRVSDRVPTFSLTFKSHTPRELVRILAQKGIFAWSGNHYALPFTEAAGLEPDGTLRLGALHYNSPAEIDRVVDCLRAAIQ